MMDDYSSTYYEGLEDERERILDLIDNQIDYFKKPETELNKAMVFYLEELKSVINEKTQKEQKEAKK